MRKHVNNLIVSSFAFVLMSGLAWGQNLAATDTNPFIDVPEIAPTASTNTEQSSHPTTPLTQEAITPTEEMLATPKPIINIPGLQESQSTYTLGKEDVINISVMRHPEVSGQYIINSEGKIQYGFVGDVKVEGMTKEQVKDILTEILGTYIVTPEVTVTIVGYNSKVIYVVGEVGAPGKIFMRGDTITVHEALIEAGLPLLSAAGKRSKVITPSEEGNAVLRDVDVEALLYAGDLRENLVMEPGDTLYVPPTFLTKTMRAINPIAQPLGTAANAGRRVVAPFP